MTVNLVEMSTMEMEQKKQHTAYYDLLDLVVSGSHMYGVVYVPNRKTDEKVPCICLFHGFPGVTCNDDLAQELMRQGFLVIRPYHRGAWGSEGIYSFTGAIEDAVAVATYAHEEGAEKYDIDREHIFLVGHSMGGQTVLNATRKLPFVKATVALAAFNMAKLFRTGREEEFKEAILPLGRLLHSGEEGALFENAKANYRLTDLESAAEELKDRNIYLIEGKYDEIAVPKEYIFPFWEKLSAYHTEAVRKLDVLEAGHDFAECRQDLPKSIVAWLRKEELL